MIDWDATLHRPVFECLGIPAVYVDGAGIERPCKVRWSEMDRDLSLAGIGVTAAARIARVRVAEVPDAREGGRLRVGDKLYRVDKAARRDDRRLIWTLELS